MLSYLDTWRIASIIKPSRQGLAEVLELEIPFEMMFIDDPPAGIQLPCKAGHVLAGQRRDAAFTGHALFLRQIRHLDAILADHPSFSKRPPW